MEMKRGDHRFYLQDGDTEAGEIVFSKVSDGIISIDHTRVNKEYQGQGLAGKLLNAMLDFADLENLQIVPVCEYAKAQFKLRPEIRFLLANNYQELLEKLEENKED